MRWMLVVAIVSAVACNSSKKSESGAGAAGQTAASAVQTYTIAGDGSDKVKIEVAIPSSWKADTSDPDAPTFKISGAQVRQLTFVTLTSLQGDAKEQLATAIRMQFGDAAGAERQDLPDGRVWMSEDEGRSIHARMFVPYDGGVLMGYALLAKDSAGTLPEIRKVFETIKVVP
jgi:hypothetical protein